MPLRSKKLRRFKGLRYFRDTERCFWTMLPAPRAFPADDVRREHGFGSVPRRAGMGAPTPHAARIDPRKVVSSCRSRSAFLLSSDAEASTWVAALLDSLAAMVTDVMFSDTVPVPIEAS